LLVLMSAAVAGLVGISDKTAIYRYARSPLTLPLLIGMAQSTSGIVIIAVAGIPDEATLETTAYAAISGVLFGFGGILGQRILFTQEVSRTVPIQQSAPIFVALMAMFLLNESISLMQWIGIVATVSGCALLSIRFNSTEGSIMLHKSFYILMLSALLIGGANVVGKIALEELPVVYTHGVRMFTLGIIFLTFSVRPLPWADVKSYFLRRSPVLLLVGINEFVTANVAMFLFLWALSEGPVSLVTAVWSTRALFIVLYGIGLATIWRGALGEQISPSTVVAKVLSASLIVAGVAAIAV
jgi:drug/metabolite transporter (DMT)-like permease